MMLSKYSNIQVVEPEHRTCDMSSGIPTAKMFIWDNLDIIKSMGRVLSSMLGIHNQKDLVSFLKEYKYDLETKESVVGFDVVTA